MVQGILVFFKGVEILELGIIIPKATITLVDSLILSLIN